MIETFDKEIPELLEDVARRIACVEDTYLTYHEAIADFDTLKSDRAHFNVLHRKQEERTEAWMAIVKEIEDQGVALFDKVFTGEMREFYCSKIERYDVKTIMIYGDGQEIPWEIMMAPGTSSTQKRTGRKKLSKGEFFGEKFLIGRWFSGYVKDFTVMCLEQYRQEGKRLVEVMVGMHGISEKEPGRQTVKQSLSEEGCNFLHYAGHGEIDNQEPCISIGDKMPLRAVNFETMEMTDQHGVFLNACFSAYITRDKKRCFPGVFLAKGTKVFIGPQWRVDDDAALEFSIGFYESLTRGMAIGEAVRAARSRGETLEGEKKDNIATLMSYVVYGHPNPRIKNKHMGHREE